MNQRLYSRSGARRSANGVSANPAPFEQNGNDYLPLRRPDDGFIARELNAVSPLTLDAFDAARPRPSIAAAETFRTLALTVDLLLSESSLRSVVVLSALPGDGRSLTADLLARGLSEIRPPVRLLDADPFNAPKRYVPALNGQSHTLDLTDASAAVPDFARLPLASEVFANHRDFLSAVRYILNSETSAGATVVIDVPSCSSSSVPFVVAEMAEAAIYVARTRTEASGIHAEMRAQLDLLGVQLLGVVFNEK